MEISNLIDVQSHTLNTIRLSEMSDEFPGGMPAVPVTCVPFPHNKWAKHVMPKLETLYTTSIYHGDEDFPFETIISSLQKISVPTTADLTDVDVERARNEAKKIEKHLLENQKTVNLPL